MQVNLPLDSLTKKQLLRLIYVTMKEDNMALNEAIQNLTNEVSTQLQQTADAIAQLRSTVESLEINKVQMAELKAQLSAVEEQNDAAAASIQAQADALAADNPVDEPAPEPEPEPEPAPEPEPEPEPEVVPEEGEFVVVDGVEPAVEGEVQTIDGNDA